MKYPLDITFKFWTFAPKVTVTDAEGQVILFVKQKLFRLKEAISVCADVDQMRPLYEIKADRIIDFSARYNFINNQGMTFGAVKRRGIKSLWRAHYDILEGTSPVLTIQEENPWVKVMDSLFSELPIVGLFSGYVFNPVYLVSRTDGRVVMRLEKRPSFLSKKFTVKQVDQLSQSEELQAVLSLLMMILLERSRG